MMSYLIYMCARLMEMKRILKDTGSIYLHCNQFASHYLKVAMDAIFCAGRGKNFVNELVWNYGTPSGGRSSGKKPVKVHDVLLVYAMSYGHHIYNRQYTPYNESYVSRWFRHKDEAGRAYQTRSRKGKIIRQYLDESFGMPLSTVWSDIMQLSSKRGWFPKANQEETGYPTQKPLTLLQRIVRASSNEGDMVLDPFCGCATACVASEIEHRQWIGIDVSPKAYDLVELRLKKEVKLGVRERAGDHKSMFGSAIRRTDIPSDRGGRPSKDIKHVLYGKQEGLCKACRVHFPFRNMTKDHITSTDRGGPNTDDNLQLLCGACNSKKGNRSMEELIAKLKEEGIRR